MAPSPVPPPLASGPLPPVANERIRDYAPGSPERATLEHALRELSSVRTPLPCIIGGRAVESRKTSPLVMPHAHAHVLGDVHMATQETVDGAIAAAEQAHLEWASRSFEDRAAVFLRAAELLSGPWRAAMNAATMLGQSKTAHQAEIDAACELADFWRWNCVFADRMHRADPLVSPAGQWNRMDLRPLEGFVYAITPFNFTAIAGNLPCAPALMGNTVVWKPAASQALAAYHTLLLLQEAGLPPGVINLVYGAPAEISERVLAHPSLAGVHFTGSTEVFHALWQRVAQNLPGYREFPRLVGETGGKDFIVAHPSADLDALAVAILRGGYEYQGQKCSAASRVYVPEDLWPALRTRLCEQLAEVNVGDVRDFGNFMGAVIDAKAYARHVRYLAAARTESRYKIAFGGSADNATGYFVQPTLVESLDPLSPLMSEEIFGPIVTVYAVPRSRSWEETLALVDRTSPYGLTGAVFAQDRAALESARARLRWAAGNFYVNDKPTGAVVGQQPFGGGRASGTNDKAGSGWNLARWVSPRVIKETFVPPTDWRYPFLASS